MSAANRYGGFKARRARWITHCQSSLLRPVLLIDEAQLVSADCLTELRILQSDHFDSHSLLFTILCGDGRLPERFRSAELLPLGSRIGPRLPLSHLSVARTAPTISGLHLGSGRLPASDDPGAYRYPGRSRRQQFARAQQYGRRSAASRSPAKPAAHRGNPLFLCTPSVPEKWKSSRCLPVKSDKSLTQILTRK
ncbi:MAG: ATP-binding protein [Desulfobacterales bacterium]